MVILTTGSGLWKGGDFTENKRLSSGCGRILIILSLLDNLPVLTLDPLANGLMFGAMKTTHSSATMVRAEQQNESKYSIHYDHH